MKQGELYENDCLIYPGIYVPMLKEVEIQSAIKDTQEGEMFLPPVNLTERSDAYKVEVAIPGVSREHIRVNADGNLLSVFVMQPEKGDSDKERFKLHEFNYECFLRQIVLPENANIEFVSAEYRDGILRFIFPKSRQQVQNQHNNIVVY